MNNKIAKYLLFIMASTLASCGTTIELGSVDDFKKHSINFTQAQLVDSLTIKLNEIANRSEYIGFSASILNKDSIFYQGAFGKQSKETGFDFTTKTVMPIGSISKTLAGVSIMKAVELGMLNLEDDINDYLSFKIYNPHHPSQTITVKHLATHTSGLKYTEHYEKAYIFDEEIPAFYKNLKGKQRKFYKSEIERGNSNVKMGMEEFIKNIYSHGGKWYSEDNFLSKPTGSKYAYCNENAALAALVIERASGQDYKSFVDKHILVPIGMTQSGWSMSTYKNQDKGQLYLAKHPIPNYNLITYPDGGFVTNIEEFTVYFQHLIKGYYGQDNILNSESYGTLFKEHHREGKNATGLFMELSGNQIGHNGGDPGITTFAYFDQETSFGYILLFKYGVSKELIDTLREMRKYCAYMSTVSQ